MSALALPDIQRCSPVTVSGNTPVLNVLQPVAETSLTDVFRNPIDGIIVADQIILYCCHFDEPGLAGIVDQRCVAAPAVRIVVLKFRSVKKLALFIKINKYKGICFLYEYTCIRGFFRHISLSVYKLYKRKVIFASHTVIVLTECRRDMNDTSTVTHGNIIIAYYIMCFFLLLCSGFSGTFPERLIFFVFQICSFICFQNLVSLFILFGKLAKNPVQKSFRHIISISVCCLYLTVGLIRVYAERQVGRKRPWCGCPCQEIRILSYNLKTDDGRTFFYSLIALGNLLCRKRSSAARAVRHNLKSFIKEILIPDFFQRPPLRLNIIVVISYIRMIHVGPETNGRRKILPHSLVFPDAFFTLLDKRLHTVSLDLFLAVKPELFLNLKLYRKSVSIPSGLTGNHVALHGTISGDHILDNAGQYMTDMRLAVGCGRSVIESIGFSFFTAVHTFFKNMVFFPELLDLFFAVNKVQVRIYLLIHDKFLLSYNW